MKLTKNFYLRKFIESKFYNDAQQRDIWHSYAYEEDDILPNLQKLANQLQTLRDYLKRPIIINIAYRPVWWELQQGRSGNSQHTLGKAADIKVKGIKPKKVANAIEHLINNGDMLQGGLGRYNTFTHYDIGYNGKKRRW